jgi:hypothetical protein
MSHRRWHTHTAAEDAIASWAHNIVVRGRGERSQHNSHTDKVTQVRLLRLAHVSRHVTYCKGSVVLASALLRARRRRSVIIVVLPVFGMRLNRTKCGAASLGAPRASLLAVGVAKTSGKPRVVGIAVGWES